MPRTPTASSAAFLKIAHQGADKRGAFVVQCIAVDDKTVSVVQGIDYAQRKDLLGAFADRVQAAILQAAK